MVRGVTPGLSAPRSRPTCADPSCQPPWGSCATITSLWGPPGPHLGPIFLFSWEVSAQLGSPHLFNPTIWSGLRCSLEEFPSILNNGVDHTLVMVMRRNLVRLRNEVAAIVSRPL